MAIARRYHHATPKRLALTVDFTGPAHSWPILKSKVAIAQNLKTMSGSPTAGLEGTLQFANGVASGIWGNLEFGQFKTPGEPLSVMVTATYDGTGDATSMANAPSAAGVAFASQINSYDMWRGIQLTGRPPGFTPLTSTPLNPIIRHPAEDDITGGRDLISEFIRGTRWPFPGKWSLWNEIMRTMTDCKQGKNRDGSSFTETTTAYETVRRPSLKQDAVNLFVLLYLGTFSKAGTKDIGKWSKAGFGSVLAGDRKTGGGRCMPDLVRSGLQGLIDAYVASVLPASQVTLASFISNNDFGNRGEIMFSDNEGQLGGLDLPYEGTQSAPGGSFKNNGAEGGEEDGTPSDTRMLPACETLTMMAADLRLASLSTRAFSYWYGGVDGFVSDDGVGGYIKRHRYTASEMWHKLPTRRVDVQYVQGTPKSDGGLLTLQGPMSIAGIDPGNQTASLLMWNEGPDAKVLAPVVKLPSALAGVTPTIRRLDEANSQGVTSAWDGQPFSAAPRTIYLLTWANGTSPETRRKPLADGVRTPAFLRKVDTYKRPKGACAYLDQVRGVAWICPSSSYTGALATGAAWSNAPDGVWLTLWAHLVDNASAPVSVTCDYGSGPVTLWTSTVGAITAGQVVALDIVGNAPGGWSAGAREADISISHTGSSSQRLEVWLSGTLVKANAVKGV